MASHGIADVVVVAAGSSQRMGGTDKLDAEIGGRPVLRRSIEAMRWAPEVARVVVVTTPERATRLAEAPWLPPDVRIVEGGRRRQDSVAAGLRATDAPVVLVHDAARPLVTPAVVARVTAAARRDGAAIPVLPVVDALKHVDGDVVAGTAERRGLYRAQTPQGARRPLLVAAAERHAAGPSLIADEAELLALDGIAVTTVPGDASNMKITLPDDVAMARRLAGTPTTRVTWGFDSHPFGTEIGLQLGGITIEDLPRLHGHSDGDAVLHALCDALLAAVGEGDLGQRFPSGDAATRGIDSRALVRDCVERVSVLGSQPTSADITITGARPRFGAERLEAMALAIGGLLGLDPAAVSVKAASGNLAGDEGAGRVISATCLLQVAAS